MADFFWIAHTYERPAIINLDAIESVVFEPAGIDVCAVVRLRQPIPLHSLGSAAALSAKVVEVPLSIRDTARLLAVMPASPLPFYQQGDT